MTEGCLLLPKPKQITMKVIPAALYRGLFPISILVAVLAAIPAARGQSPEPAVLEPMITTATRTPVPARTLGTAVDQFTAAELARRQITSLSQALGGVPGAPHFSTGASGAVSSIFLRGSNSNQTLFLVDGVRFNDPNTDYSVYLGGSCVSACDSLEVAHGPQSTLYGGEAVGGVISLRSQRGSGAPTASIGGEVGSFGTVQGAVAAQGEKGPWAYNFSTQGGHTDNDRANNDFDRATTALRVDRTINENVSIGGTARWFHGEYGDPGDRYTNDPNNQTREDNVLVTGFGDAAIVETLKSRVTVAGQDRRFIAESPRSGPATAITKVTNRRALLDWQNTYTGIERHRLMAGLNAEANHTRNTGFGDINKKQTLLAAFVQDEYSPTDNLYLIGAIRSDDYDTFGRATTGSASVAWLVADRSLKLRSKYGTSFRSPSFLDLYGTSLSYVGNPNLNAERARSWDFGVDYYLPDQRGTLSATWFKSNYRDLIVYDFSSFPGPGTVRNVERAETQGVEFAAQTSWTRVADVRVAYTYLEADNLTQGSRLIRRPRHSADIDVWHDFGIGISVGGGVAFVADRRDVNAETFAYINAEDYTVARVYAAWQVTPKLAVKARIENVLNEHYEEVNGYPALGTGVYAGATWNF